MQFTGSLKEHFWLSSLAEESGDILKQAIKSGLTIFWNLEEDTYLSIDGIEHLLKHNQIIFLTEFHKVHIQSINNSRVLRFNRPFYCINHNSDDECNGILFFGAAQVPIIQLPEHEVESFETLWKMLHKEMQSKDDMQIEMLRILLKQLVILCTRLHKEQNKIAGIEKGRLDIVRKFNSLVEMHYKSKHSVADYAELLNKSPKTLCNLFSQLTQNTPLTIIQERLVLEARRLLHYTERTIKDITYDLGFEDIQTFSRFFKNKEGISPTEFRKSSQQTLIQGNIANI
ncbi:MAG: helix-turn-helix domain-containing protein [Ferruginibacter sp.]